MTASKAPGPRATNAPPRRRAAQLATAKTERAIPAVVAVDSRSGFRKPESGPTESVTTASGTRKRPKRP